MPSSLATRSIRLSKCWSVLRTDGITKRITDHNTDLTVLGNVYSPVKGFQVTSREQESGDIKLEMRGSIDDLVFSFDDFVTERYAEAIVTEFLVDWKHPFMGPYRTTKFWIGQPKFDFERFSAPLEGILRFLKHSKQKLISKLCPYKTFDVATCKASTTGKRWTGVNVATVVDRTRFVVTGGTITNSLGIDAFMDGEIIWETGANAGKTSNVRTNLDSGTGAYDITLYLPVDRDIVSGDDLQISLGDDHTIDDCNNTFANAVNFGGEPEVPGSSVAANVERNKKN